MNNREFNGEDWEFATTLVAVFLVMLLAVALMAW